jgi:anti-sigma-K factor RskA
MTMNQDDIALKVLLERHWQAPMAAPDAIARLTEATRQRPSRWRWALPGAAVAAALLLGLWVAQSFVPVQKAVPTTAVASLSDEDMMSYVFATYELEETL